MFDIQHDSPVPIHEQITSQIRAHVASGAVKEGTVLAEHRTFAQELLTNPQVVARAYADLEAEGVLTKALVVKPGAAAMSAAAACNGAHSVSNNSRWNTRLSRPALRGCALRRAACRGRWAGCATRDVHIGWRTV